MLRKTVKYRNADDAEVEKVIYFNISANELVEKEAESNGGYSKKLKAIAESKVMAEVYPVVIEFLRDGYGIRTEDGDFVKDPTGEAWTKFRNSQAYEALMDELLMDPQQNGTNLANFINSMLPPDLVKKVQEQQATPGFRPGADTRRPTPPVAGEQPVVDMGEVPNRVEPGDQAAAAQPVQVAPTEPVVVEQTPAESIPIQQTSEPREPEFPGAQGGM